MVQGKEGEELAGWGNWEDCIQVKKSWAGGGEYLGGGEQLDGREGGKWNIVRRGGGREKESEEEERGEREKTKKKN